MEIGGREKLALFGGPKAKQTAFAVRNRHGEEEKRLLREVIGSDTLSYWNGTKVSDLEKEFAALCGRRHCIACSSGTAAVHIALGALEIPPGNEVIYSAISEMGSVTGALFQGLVPVFADVEPGTLNMDPVSVRQRISARTKALVVFHHAGLAADMEAFLKIGREFGIPIIEDCCQAFCCRYKTWLAGTMSALATFSLNPSRHVTCGSGGLILTDDDHLRYVARLFMDRCRRREEGIDDPLFAAPNYQMTELQGAVALAQMRHVYDIAERRRNLGSLLDGLLSETLGVVPQRIPPGCKHSYYAYLFGLDIAAFGCTVAEFSRALSAEGIPNSVNLITCGRPLYLYAIFQNRSAFPGTSWPFSSDWIYRPGDCPIAEDVFQRWIAMPMSENYTEQDIEEIAFGITKVASHFLRLGKASGVLA